MAIMIDQSVTTNTPANLARVELINSVWKINNSLTLSGQPNILVHSALTADSLENNGWIIDTQNSDIDISGNLTGTGQITELGSSMTIGGSGSASETIGIADHSQLYLDSSGFGSKIDLDSTSAIHIETPNAIASVVSDLTANGSPEESLPFHGLFNVQSITPGYTPEAEFTFGGPGDQPIGVTIVDKPTPSTTNTIVGSTNFDTASTPSSDTISLDGTSHLLIAVPLGMNFLATIDMTAGSKVYLASGIQGSSGIPSSITEFPQLNLVDFYSGSTLEAQLHIHNESPGTTIWAANAFKGVVTFTDSVSQPANQAGIGYPPDVAVPIHVVG